MVVAPIKRAPEMANVGDVFTLKWAEENIQLKIDHIVESSRGDVRAEYTFYYGEGYLYNARIDMLTPSAKHGLAAELTKRLKDLDWDTIIEQASALTLRKFRQGEPIIKLSDLPPRPCSKYLCWPFIRDKEPTILYGEGGSGKSMLEYLIALSVQTGIPVFNWRPQRGNVLLLDWETCKYTARERMDAIVEGMELGILAEDYPIYRRCKRSLPNEITEIQRIVLENNIQLAIVDSVSMACGGDATSQEVISKYWMALNTLGISTLAIDHKPKDGDSIYGSVFKFNEARMVFEIKKVQDSGADFIDTGIYHRKANDSRLIPPISMRIDFENDANDVLRSVTFHKQDIMGIPELAKQSSLKDRIMAELKGGAMSTSELTEVLNVDDGVLRTTLNRYKPFFIKVNNKWGIKTQESYFG